MDFQVTVDGKRLDPSVDIRATRFGVDVTDVLKRYAIPPTMIAAAGEAGALNDRLDDLPQAAREELARYGVIDWNTTFGRSPMRTGIRRSPILVSDLPGRSLHRGDASLQAGAAAFLLHQGGSRFAREA
jgi:hypothetical protein